MVKYYNGKIIDVRGLPYCVEHEMQLTTDSKSSIVTFKCPECKTSISKQELDSIFGKAQSILEKRIRELTLL
jgi:hypothetical protein